MNRLSADLLAARVFLTMLGKERATPTAENHITFDLYDPGSARKTILLLHGLTLPGENDPRLVRFARALAASGRRVVAPILENLKEFRFDPADRDRLLEIAVRFRAETGTPLPVLAFSAGASLVLTAASQASERDLFGPLVLFSPIYDFETVWQTFHQATDLPPEGTQAWDDFIWIHCVIAYRNRDKLKLDAPTLSRLQDMFYRWPTTLTTGEKKQFYEKILVPLNPPALRGYFHEGEVLAQLSPRGKLAELTQPVMLLQSPGDSLLPADEMQMLHTELKHRPAGQTRFLSTPLLAHANLGSLTHLKDAFQLVHCLGAVFQ